ncbi:hypothetical protein [Sphingomonas taxi]|nr:hypothetical protein [Sphingomonas taxi]
MPARHRLQPVDFGLRAVGALLCCIAYVAIAHLTAMHIRPRSAGALAYGLATAGFLGASAGSTMTVLGHHLFDAIEVSQRWQHRPQAITQSYLQPEFATAMDRSDVEMLVVGMDADGGWTVLGGEGWLLGRFPTRQAAQHYARDQRRQRPAISIASSSGHPPRLEGRLSLASVQRPNGSVGNV